MADTRSRMIDAAVHALQQHGVAGMSFTEVLRDSGAARGAIYHHFPGGKAQLVTEAAAHNGAEVAAALAALPAEDVPTVVRGFLAAVRPVVCASACGGGCAVAAVTVAEDGPRSVAAAAFAEWGRVLGERLTAAGLAADAAPGLATTLITVLEGAHVLCRAAGSVEPFDRAARTILALIPEPDRTTAGTPVDQRVSRPRVER